MTTNGTLLRPADLDLMRGHPFAVTVSLDGAADVNDTQRPMRNGRPGGWALATARVSGLLADPGQAKLAARATVTRHDMDVSARLRALVDLGFPEAGVAPLRGAPDEAGALREADWTVYLHELIRASRAELGAAQARPARATDEFRGRAQANTSRRLLAVPMRRWRWLFFGIRRGTLVRVPSRHRRSGVRDGIERRSGYRAPAPLP